MAAMNVSNEKAGRNKKFTAREMIYMISYRGDTSGKSDSKEARRTEIYKF